jgi:hypothetical protein
MGEEERGFDLVWIPNSPFAFRITITRIRDHLNSYSQIDVPKSYTVQSN